MADVTRTDDHLLLARVASGDEDALVELHRRHQRLAHAIAGRLLRDHHAVREVVQDAFVDLWRTAASYEPARASVVTWLVRLVRLRAIDRVRRDHGARRGGGEAAAALVDALQVADDVDVAAEVEHAGRAERVRAAVAQLPEHQRRVVELAFLHGHSHAELAELLELPLGTVKTRTFRGLARLAELLADEREGAVR
jgi:RNA polymerase sigma-70 factor (ECF subfamily)